jgi:hypothetical protein
MYQIIGLTKIDYNGFVYITNNKNIILYENGKALTKDKIFTEYTIYLQCMKKNKYYSIRLYESNCASYSGKLCSNGNIEIKIINENYIIENRNYITKKDLYIRNKGFITKKFVDHYDDYIKLYGYSNQQYNTKKDKKLIFEYSGCGWDETNPCGYISINMDLFYSL